MSPTDADACSKCGRLLPPSQQACVFGGMIVCAECDKVLRSKQDIQPAPSPKPAVSAETVTTQCSPTPTQPVGSRWTRLIWVVAGICAFVALIVLLKSNGGGAPSDSDVEGAVRKHYAFESRMGRGEFQIAEIRVTKRGKYFKKQLGGGSDEGYPVRVFVKGIVAQHWPAGLGGAPPAKPFEGEMDFVMRYFPHDQSKVDPGPGEWVAGR